MIPKRIHYCWLSAEPYPEKVQQCMASWKRYMPDWDFVLWDYEKIKDIDSIWLKECISAKKWAFAADFVRLWAIYHEGGVYLDSDVLLFQSIEPFLKDRLFIGRESSAYHTFDDGKQVYLTSHCFGAEAGHPFLKKNLSYYENRHFLTCSSLEISNSLRYDMLMMPYIQSRLLEPFGYDPAPLAADRQTLQLGMEVYPPNYFCWEERKFSENEVHYAEHLGQGSWREPEYWKSHTRKPYTITYKIGWRIVAFINKILEKFDYKLVHIHPDRRQ